MLEGVSHERMKIWEIHLPIPGVGGAGALDAGEEVQTGRPASRASQQITGGNALLSQGPQITQILTAASTKTEPEEREKSVMVASRRWIGRGGHRRRAGPCGELFPPMCRTTTRVGTVAAETILGTDKRRIKVHQVSQNKQVCLYTNNGLFSPTQTLFTYDLYVTPMCKKTAEWKCTFTL